MSPEEKDARPRVLIAGGGIAGLEAALALADLAGDRADLALLAPEPDFLFKPLTVEEPFTHQPAERRELRPALSELGVELVVGALDRVSPEAHTITTKDGTELAYDVLVACLGGRPRPAYRDVETFWSHRIDLPADDLIRQTQAGSSKTLALVAPPATTLDAAALRARAAASQAQRGARRR